MKLVFAELGALRRYVSREFAYVLAGLVEELESVDVAGELQAADVGAGHELGLGLVVSGG